MCAILFSGMCDSSALKRAMYHFDCTTNLLSNIVEALPKTECWLYHIIMIYIWLIFTLSIRDNNVTLLNTKCQII